MSTKIKYTLSKAERLKSRKTIEQLFKKGKAFSLFPFRVVYLINSDNSIEEQTNITTQLPINNNLQMGVTVSTKYFKKAVHRNRVKRVVREAYRLQKNELQQKVKQGNSNLNVFFIYTGNELPTYDFVSDKINFAIKRLIKIYDEHTKTNS